MDMRVSLGQGTFEEAKIANNPHERIRRGFKLLNAIVKVFFTRELAKSFTLLSGFSRNFHEDAITELRLRVDKIESYQEIMKQNLKSTTRTTNELTTKVSEIPKPNKEQEESQGKSKKVKR